MRSTAVLRFVLHDLGRDLRTLAILRRIFSVGIILLLLSTACVTPVVATATKETNQPSKSLREEVLRDGLATDEQRLATQTNSYSNSDGLPGALETGSDKCTPDNATETSACDTTKTATSHVCHPTDNRTTNTQTTIDDTTHDGTPTKHGTDSGTAVTEPSSTHSTMTEPNTKPSQTPDHSDVPGSDLLPDINSPIIALIGVLCVLGGLVALAR